MARPSRRWGSTACVCALLGAAAFAVVLSVSGPATAAGKEPVGDAIGLHVAVVDMDRVLAGSKEWRDGVEERSRMQDTARRTLNKLARKDQVLRNEYENLPPGTEERQDKAAEIEAALQEYDEARQELEGDIARQHDESVRKLFAGLNRAVSTYAQEHGIALVLKKQSLQATEPRSPGESLQMATMEVLYADPALDISADIVELLNAEYPGPIEVK